MKLNTILYFSLVFSVTNAFSMDATPNKKVVLKKGSCISAFTKKQGNKYELSKVHVVKCKKKTNKIA